MRHVVVKSIVLALSLTSVVRDLSGQTIADECARVAPAPASMAHITPPDGEVDFALVYVLAPYLDGPEIRGEDWPGPAIVDSLWHADSTALYDALVFIMTDNLYFSQVRVSAAARAYDRLDGPVDRLLEEFRVPLSDRARTALIAAIPRPLAANEQPVLFRQACFLAIGLEALTPALPDMQRTGAQGGPPRWYGNWIWDLEKLRERLSGQLALEFERIIGPVLRRSELVPRYWPAK